MFFKKIHNLKDSLIFRMTIWYTGIFAVSSFVVLSVFYFRIQTVTLERTDEELREEIGEFAEVMDQEGRQGVITEIDLEAESEPATKIFFRLLTGEGKEIARSDLTLWGDLELSKDVYQALNEGKIFLETRTILERGHRARVVYSRISPSDIMQIGMSLEDNEAYLNIFRNLMALLMVPIFFLAVLVGWLMAQKALVGLEEVTQTAEEISRGFYGKRVKVKNRTTEIEKLAVTFNHMVDQLQSLIKAMRDMTDNIAHDLRSPLTRIRGIAEMTLLGNSTSQNYKDMAGSTIEECDNLIDLINTMLDIAEVEAGVLELSIQELDLSLLVKGACDLFKPLADEKKIRLTVNVPETAMVKGDRHKLQRIVTNLLENAIKYTPEHGEIQVSIEIKDKHTMIVIQDSGIGIAESELPHIFNRFYRCDTSRAQTGLGLGLSMVKIFTEALGGTVTASSQPNKGSTFTVVMPV